MHIFDGAIAQLGERYRGTVEVGGSIPPSSTIPSFLITGVLKVCREGYMER